jgi:elongation factor Ts
MAITAEQVKALRDRTGAGMMDCKTALTEAGGDMEQAIDILRKKGLAQAQKKAGRSTNEGLIANLVSADGRRGVLVEVNCESDFVARTDDFQALMREAARVIADAGQAATEEWLKDPNGPVQPLVAAAIGKLGENMAVSRFARFETGSGFIGQYIHLGGKLGVMVEVDGGGPEIYAKDELKTLVKELAMQVAAASPAYASRAEVPESVLEREKDIYRAQMAGQNKPANVIEKIIEGKLGAFYQQVVLPDQPAIRDPKMTVAQVMAAASTSLGADIRVTRFARLKVGETA